MITPDIIKQYNKSLALGLPTIIMNNKATGTIFISHFSASCYGLFYEQIPYLPEANKQVLGTGKPKIFFKLYK